MRKNIPSLKSEAGVSVTSTRGKLEVLQRHCLQLGKRSNFDAELKEEVESNMIDIAACWSCVKKGFSIKR